MPKRNPSQNPNSLQIPSLNMWRWRAEQLLLQQKPPNSEWVAHAVSRFFDRYPSYEQLKHGHGVSLSSDKRSEMSREPLSDKLSSLVLREAIAPRGNAAVTVTDVPAFKTVISVPFGNYEFSGKLSSYRVIQINDEKFIDGLGLVIDKTVDGSLYDITVSPQQRVLGHARSSAPEPQADTLSLGGYIDSAEADLTSPDTVRAAQAYNRHVRALPLADIVEVVQFHEAIQSINFDAIRKTD